VNQVNAGSTVPLQWTLRDAAGNVYANMNAVQSIGSKQVRCPNGPSVDPNLPESGIGTNGVAGVSGGSFHYNWATDKKWAGTCRTLLVHFSDGSTQTANFQFK
jgi:hypothetical protein